MWDYREHQEEYTGRTQAQETAEARRTHLERSFQSIARVVDVIAAMEPVYPILLYVICLPVRASRTQSVG